MGGNVMKICLFDDRKIINFYPLTYTRPVSFLRVGVFRIVDKIYHYLKPDSFPSIKTVDYLMNYYQWTINQTDEFLFINSRVIPSKKNLEKLKVLGKNQVLYLKDDIPAAFWGNLETYHQMIKLSDPDFNSDSSEQLESFEYIWDLIYANEKLLSEDANLFYLTKSKLSEDFLLPDEKRYYAVHKENIRLHKTAQIAPGVVLDASDGPIVVDENVRIMPNAVITGPAYIGPNTLIKSLAKIYGHISIGPVCKLGGEIAETIIQGYSNKQHDGFLGHAYIGEWCNLGADTNNSDLKNNYSEITVYLNGKPVNTGKRFLGLIMGDHSKSAINTSFNTGTIVGIHCNIFARTFVKKYIPSFSWVGDDFIKKYQFEKAMEVAKIVMGRRDIEFSSREWDLFEYLYRKSEEM
jgi:UDP-N-acetylglucosamine diphosphorylase/glucosamine-1-phosphate N-acetyltransferase